MFSLSLQKLLAEKGIHIERKIAKEVFAEKEKYLTDLYQNAGYESVPKSVILFLSYFDNQQIVHKGQKIEFCLSYTMQFFTHSKVTQTEKLLEKRIFPLGTMASGWYDLFADESGAVFAFHIEGDELIFYGENPFLALQNILKNSPIETTMFR
ncbi:SUKH-3 domain-containing protein [Capnocytophaga sp.]|uniref:SUKH-3 domain-containing protein n=1 Tax=Capnocytophaga sp. TaxID=44737 RepID=UPI0026DAB050|nr:SUKH-3 domain-containing protein [Capnocytophaga sp.]MDO5105927.1 SUKH-3 domain-containing protein [Capnocytophaga sp.]